MTPEGWKYERDLLREFLVEKKTPAMIRKQIKDTVDSGKRTFKFKSKTGVPVIEKATWTKTILDVRAESAGIYCEDIEVWARSVMEEAEQVLI
jgi:hypothetical protein